MLRLNQTGQFKKDYKICKKRGLDTALLIAAIDILAVPEALPVKNKDHALTGDYAGYRECHIQPDWLLIYRIEGEDLYLTRTGTHSDLFGK